ncbi:hypothetical protein FALBO_9173 [Fusarium albosuccineum]|uniref:ARCA protein n=1 Tax=Fusarium albosuccineum TaxID=1237068 RepID=A0A8H4L9F6_9HYPO|nr:hypothetical protein FALBO_9173 [Fusarium albosuccineum]
MPPAKRPCLQCKGEVQLWGMTSWVLTVAGREARQIPAKKTVFRNATTAPFNTNQTWVSGEIKEFCVNSRTSQSDGRPGTGSTAGTDIIEPAPAREAGGFNEAPSLKRPQTFPVPNPNRPIEPQHQTGGSPSYPTSSWQPGTGRSPRDVTGTSSVYLSNPDHPSPSYGRSNETALSPHSQQLYGIGESTKFPLKDPQEACLLRYFVEELSHWFDLCDERRHFQLVVPKRARQHPCLLYAIFALAARHLTRLPKYKTPQGILYQGQLLPKLTPHDAVEYTLKCIPTLRDFDAIQDDERFESIIATAVILRQLEEIDDEEEEARSDNENGGPRAEKQVNFLAIIDAVLRSPPSQTLFGRRSLIQAAYWMAVRQELYHSFTKRHPPKMILDPEYGLGASKANKIVLHTAQVAKWRWADGSEQEWLRLQKQGEVLEEEALREYQPFFARAADRSNGEIFPTIWYSSVLEVTSMQLCIIAKMVLMAENPFLGGHSTPRARWREIENEVRQMILDLCGISLCHPACPPALVHAAFGMELYGDFFTDHYERRALRGVVEKFRDARAWPVKHLSKMFQ